jgi:hypothetical protein
MDRLLSVNSVEPGRCHGACCCAAAPAVGTTAQALLAPRSSSATTAPQQRPAPSPPSRQQRGQRPAAGGGGGCDDDPGGLQAAPLFVVSTDDDDGGGAPPGSGCFDCNICLEGCREPVLTLCGHLYCWPCLFRWAQRWVKRVDVRAGVTTHVAAGGTVFGPAGLSFNQARPRRPNPLRCSDPLLAQKTPRPSPPFICSSRPGGSTPRPLATPAPSARQS